MATVTDYIDEILNDEALMAILFKIYYPAFPNKNRTDRLEVGRYLQDLYEVDEDEKSDIVRKIVAELQKED